MSKSKNKFKPTPIFSNTFIFEYLESMIKNIRVNEIKDSENTNSYLISYQTKNNYLLSKQMIDLLNNDYKELRKKAGFKGKVTKDEVIFCLNFLDEFFYGEDENDRWTKKKN